eukprot:scaffold1603_cov25-Phaeocystis_antarctica.AAC.1
MDLTPLVRSTARRALFVGVWRVCAAECRAGSAVACCRVPLHRISQPILLVLIGTSQRPAGRAQLTSSFGRHRESKVASPPSDFEVCLYAVLLANFALRDFKKSSNAADEAAFVQRVDAAIADFEGSLSSLGLRRRGNKESAAAELNDVVQ